MHRARATVIAQIQLLPFDPLAASKARARGAGRYRLEEREQGTHSHSRVKRRAFLGSLRKNFSHLPPYNLRATQRLSDMTCNMTVSTAC